MTPAEEWIDLLIRRSDELRRKGILSLGVDGRSVVLAPAEPEVPKDDDGDPVVESDEPSNAWENPASYPTGRVPTIGDVDPLDKLPPIPGFDD